MYVCCGGWREKLVGRWTLATNRPLCMNAWHPNAGEDPQGFSLHGVEDGLVI